MPAMPRTIHTRSLFNLIRSNICLALFLGQAVRASRLAFTSLSSFPFVRNPTPRSGLMPHTLRMASSDIQCIEPGPRMSSAVIHNGMVYTAGTVCEEGGENKDTRQQTIDALEDLDRVLKLSGSDKDHIVSMQVWVDDIASVPDMNAVYDEWVSKKNPPGRATVQSKLIPPYKVEFRAIAVQVKA